MSDFSLSFLGSIFILTPLSGAGREWLDENISYDDSLSWDSSGVVVGHRFIDDIVAGFEADGLCFTERLEERYA